MATTLTLPYRRFAARVNTGSPEAKANYKALAQRNALALEECPWGEAADETSKPSLVEHDFTKTFSDEKYDAFCMTGSYDSSANTEVAYAGMVAYRFALPQDYLTGSATLVGASLMLTRDRFLLPGLRVSAVLSDSASPSTSWEVVRGDAEGCVKLAAQLANPAARITAAEQATGAVEVELAGLDGTKKAYLWIYLTVEDYAATWTWYSSTQHRLYAIEGSGMVVAESSSVEFSADVSPDAAPGGGEAGVSLAVVSYETSGSALHVRSYSPGPTFANPDRLDPLVRQWDFPASYTGAGKRSMCWLPGATPDMAFYAWVGGDSYTPGDPFGACPAASTGKDQFIALTRTSAISPRIKLWDSSSYDRIGQTGEDCDVDALFGTPPATVHNDLTNKDEPTGIEHWVTPALPTGRTVRVRVVRFGAEKWQMMGLGLDFTVILDRSFDRCGRDFIHEGDFLGDGEFDIDWSGGLQDILDLRQYQPDFQLTNVFYAIVFGDAAIDRTYGSPFKEIKGHPILIERRFEETHTPPTAVGYDPVTGEFRWRIDGEDKWASASGTTYTAFRVCVYADGAGTDGTATAAKDSGYVRMPAPTIDGEYRWAAPAGWASAIAASGAKWRVFTYNAKFKTDDVGSEAAAIANT